MDRAPAKWVVPLLLVGLGVVVGFAPWWMSQRPGWSSYAGTYAHVEASVFSVEADGRVGSAFVVAPHQILTAQHLVAESETVTLIAADGTRLVGRLVGSDARSDLALLEVEADVVAPVLGPSTDLTVGDSVLAVGNPYGLGHSLAVGVLSSRRRIALKSVGLLQLSLPANPGNSGGPVFDEAGRVVGVLTGTHAQGQSIAFAVPIETVLTALPAMGHGERISRAFLGIRVGKDLSVTEVVPTGPAGRAGLLVGDRIVGIGAFEIHSREDVADALDALEGGVVAVVRAERAGAEQAIEVPLSDWAKVAVVVAGMTLRPAAGTGGEVVAIRPSSRAERAGARVGDRVLTVHGVPMRAPADVQSRLAGGEPARVELLREGQPIGLSLP